MKRPWLAPLVPLYAAGVAWRARRFTSGNQSIRRLKWPVLSIGNLSMGGAGKTPLVIALAQLLTKKSVHVDVLSRGYGRRSALAAKVDVEGAAELFGDEPLLIARATGLPVYVAPQRYDAGLLAEAETNLIQSEGGPQVHILDDGFQHRQLHRDIDILLLNRDDWRDTLLPGGNLREPLRAAKRAGVLAIPSDDPQLEGELRTWGWTGPVWRLQRRISVPEINGPVFAFCGIGRPAQFFAGLESSGLALAARKSFPDHYDYTEHVVEWLVDQARAVRAVALITTEKDAVRLGALTSGFPANLILKTAGLTVEIENESAAVDWLLPDLMSASARPSL
ncbi:MAG TPA: tetraacyldisaccharide 4'-kinase [Terracidiphilus sp.]|jgi:tetraacyldisaccharide 4'-kinase|nr:tetraacyldisaccharide 4'-kinase [Terracidiphilus sp.]